MIAKREKGSSQLFQSIRAGNWMLYQSLIESCNNLNQINEFGKSLLHEAIAYEQEKIALDLIDRKIDVLLQDNMAQVPLHYVCFYPNINIASALITAAWPVIDIRDVKGNTPLWYAVFNARGKYDLVKLLIDHHANPLSINRAGKTPLDLAIQIGDEALVQILTQ